MSIAVMQPYIFPYIGYFQLINAVDVFVFYDDVNYIKQGWVNRNKILLEGKELIFTIPIANASSFKTIRETQINKVLFDKWRTKFLKTLAQSYKNAPYFKLINILVCDVLYKDFDSIADFAIESIIKVSNYIGLNTKFDCSSIKYSETKILDKESRLIEITNANYKHKYINPIGGKDLYNKSNFAKSGVQLFFLNSKPIEYKQFGDSFVPWLSIIDVLMFNNPREIRELLNRFELQ
jgi:hypothetical protein